MQLAKAIKKGDEAFVAILRPAERDGPPAGQHVDQTAGKLQDKGKRPADEPVGLPEDIPDDLKDLLRSYKDVFTAALPAGLPPKRKVDHAIELKPGAHPLHDRRTG